MIQYSPNLRHARTHAHKPSIYHYRSGTCTTYSEHTAYRGNLFERATCRGDEQSIRSSEQSCLHITEVAPDEDEVDPADIAPLVSGTAPIVTAPASEDGDVAEDKV